MANPGEFNWTKARETRLLKLRAKNTSWAEIGAKFGISENAVRHKYRKLKKQQRQEDHPYAEYTREAIGDIIKKRRHRDGVFFITSAQPTMIDRSPDTEWLIGENLHEGFFNSVKSFCKKNDAELIIMPTRAHVKALQDQPSHFDPRLVDYIEDHFVTEYKFNRHLVALDARCNPQKVNPLNRINRNSAKYGNKTSVIVASPKQLLQLKATGNNADPRLEASTGSITVPQYLDNDVGRKAAASHVVGGLVVTIIGDTFLVHQVQTRDGGVGSFNYMGTRYYPDGKTEYEGSEAMKLGDVHGGREDRDALACTYEQFATLQPKEIYLEDIFDGTSVSPHSQDDVLEQSMQPAHFESLANEIEYTKNLIEEIWSYAPEESKLIITAANHNNFYERYLRKGRYIKDKVNFGLCHEMVVEFRNGQDPLAKRLDPDDCYIWLDENTDRLVAGVNMAGHGHRGPNGARGSAANLKEVYWRGMIGHSHSPCLVDGLLQVGHLSQKRHGYNNGPSSWALCNGVVYKYGEMSHLFIINNQWI